VLDHLGAWDEVLPLIKFTYNSNFHVSIDMAPYEAFYTGGAKHPCVGIKMEKRC